MSRLEFSGSTAKEQNVLGNLQDAVDTNLNAIVEALAVIKDNWQDENSAVCLPQFDAAMTDAISANTTCMTKAKEAMAEIESIIKSAGGSVSSGGAEHNTGTRSMVNRDARF